MDELLSDQELQDFMQSLGCEDFLDCEPPPMFDLPPPPMPPMVDTAPECDNMPLVTSLNNIQHIFHSIVIIVVSSFIILMAVFLIVVLLRRRWQNLAKQFLSPDLTSQDRNLQIGKPKESESVPKTLQNYYISDHGVLRQNIPVVPVHHPHHPPTLIIGGVPFHIVRQLNSSSDSSSLSDPNLPIYETIESDFYSEMSSVESDRGEVGSTTYQELESQFSTPVNHSQGVTTFPPVNQFHTRESRKKYRQVGSSQLSSQISSQLSNQLSSQLSAVYQADKSGGQEEVEEGGYSNERHPYQTRTQSQVILQTTYKNSPITKL